MFCRTTAVCALAILAACDDKASRSGKQAPEPELDKAQRDAALAGDPVATYLAAVDRACDSGARPSCWFQGIVCARGLLGQPVDRDRARDYFERGCGEDLSGPGCPDVLAAKKKLTDREREALAALCDSGRVDACRLGDPDGADRQLCNAGVMASCARLEPLGPEPAASAGKKTAPELGESAAPRARRAAAACDRGSGLGCGLLARAYLAGDAGLPADPRRAAAIGQRACDRDGAALGCYPAAAALEKSGRSASEQTRALELARTGCQRGDMKACLLIGEALERSQRLDSRQRGLSFSLMACHIASDKDACAAFERAVPEAVK